MWNLHNANMESALQAFLDHCPGLLFTIDPEGSFVHQSKTLRERFFAETVEKPSLVGLARAEDKEAVEAFLQKLAASDEPAACTFRVVDKSVGYTRLQCRARRGQDGRGHGVLEPVWEDRGEHQVHEMMIQAVADTLDIVLWAVDKQGVFVFHDGRALATAGLKRGQYLGMNIFEIYSSERVKSVRGALAGTPFHTFSENHNVHWESWTVPLRGPTGEVEYCVGVSLDNSERVRTEMELKRRLETISRQQEAIHELAAPVLQVWDHVLAVPLIGMMDGSRLAELGERLLGRVSRSDIKFTVLDMTGIDAIDTAIASDIMRLLSSLQLLGVEGMISGISPQVAQTMVGLGVEFGTIRTHRSLREALRACLISLRAASQTS